jgi:hypothetical protein
LQKLQIIPRLDRFKDIHDAVAILKVITDLQDCPLFKEKIKTWETDGEDPITDDALTRVNNLYAFSYRYAGLISVSVAKVTKHGQCILLTRK